RAPARRRRGAGDRPPVLRRGGLLLLGSDLGRRGPHRHRLRSLLRRRLRHADVAIAPPPADRALAALRGRAAPDGALAVDDVDLHRAPLALLRRVAALGEPPPDRDEGLLRRDARGYAHRRHLRVDLLIEEQEREVSVAERRPVLLDEEASATRGRALLVPD